MREIRFRGQQIYEHKWVYGGVHIADDEALIIERRKGNDCFHSPVKRESIGQFTGLHDKNGVEIYEGDILQPLYNGITAFQVKFENGAFNCNRFNLPRCKVLGNVFEHPELLK